MTTINELFVMRVTIDDEHVKKTAHDNNGSAISLEEMLSVAEKFIQEENQSNKLFKFEGFVMGKDVVCVGFYAKEFALMGHVGFRGFVEEDICTLLVINGKVYRANTRSCFMSILRGMSESTISLEKIDMIDGRPTQSYRIIIEFLEKKKDREWYGGMPGREYKIVEVNHKDDAIYTLTKKGLAHIYAWKGFAGKEWTTDFPG